MKTKTKKDQLARALADYDNLRKRVEAEKAGWEKLATAKVVAKILPVLDILENAQKHIQDVGLDLAIKEFKNALSEVGVEEIKAVCGEDFDPTSQEAVEIVPGGKAHKIADIVESGWKMKDVDLGIRVAKVKVYGEKPEKEQEIEKELERGEYV